MKQMSGRIGLLIVAIIWGNGFVASALALDYFTVYQILALRFSLAFVTALVIYFRHLKKMTFEDVKRGGIIGAFLFFAFLFQTIGLQYTTASKNAFLTAVNIVIVPFLSWLILRDRVPKNAYIGAAVTLVGIGFLSMDGSVLTGVNKGDLFTLICAIFFGLQIFYTDYYVKDIEPGIIMISQMGMAALLSWITVIFTGQQQITITLEAMMPILYLGLVSTLIAYGIQTWAQKRTSSTQAAVVLSTEAFFGMLSSVIILSERITTSMLIGAVLIFMGVLIVEINPKIWQIYK